MSKVYYIKVENEENVATLSNKTIRLLQKFSCFHSIKKNDFVGIKIHFGEKDNIGHIDPFIAKRVAEFLKQKSERVFIADTNTLYESSRSNSVEHLKLAHQHNFNLSKIGIPVIIADGLKGRNFVVIKIPGRHLKSVKIASDIANSDFLLCLSHMTGHMQAGFGASIKNLGMGCASRAGKLEQHSNVLPAVLKNKCEGCGTCLRWCPPKAIIIEGGKAAIMQNKCIGCGECTVVCKNGAIEIKWSESIRNLQEKMAEYALGAAKAIGHHRMCYVNFLTHITKDCDCMTKNEPAICDDIGIMASEDPVALDKASVDMIIKANRKDILKIGYPDIDWSVQLSHAEVIGLGRTSYKVEEIV
jgi:uncharacterized Fe-S center protein